MENKSNTHFGSRGFFGLVAILLLWMTSCAVWNSNARQGVVGRDDPNVDALFRSAVSGESPGCA